MIVKGGYEFAYFDTMANFLANENEISALPTAITDLLSKTNFVPATENDIDAAGREVAAGNKLKLTIRSANYDADLIAALEAMQDARTPLAMRLLPLGGYKIIDPCEDGWVKGAAASSISHDATVKKLGGKCLKIVMPSQPVTGTMATKTIADPGNFGSAKAILLFLKSSSAEIGAGVLSLTIGDCGMSLPAINSTSWLLVRLIPEGPNDLAASANIDILYENASAGMEGAVIYVDAIAAEMSSVTLKNVILTKVPEFVEFGKFNAQVITGTASADTEENLITENF
jgi:hypothetical protein